MMDRESAWWHRPLRWSATALGAVGALSLVIAAGAAVVGYNRMHPTYPSNLARDAVPVPTNATAVARGRRLAKMVGCMRCHGGDLGGTEIEREPWLYTITGPNLTSGRGGVGRSYSVQDWVRAIRHGMAADGRGLINMPSNYYQALSGDDLGALAAFLAKLPPVDRTLPPTSATPLGLVLVGVGAFGEPVPAELIDHSASVPGAVPAGVTTEYGSYLVAILNCRVCHGERLTGAHTEGHAPAPDITATGRLGTWTAANFMRTARTGALPEGRIIDLTVMPWDRYVDMTDDELQAIFGYLQSLGSEH